ncbi:MAG TPA: paraquat-inducible membrane protein A [Gammaproteobacteria bacterium]|nr:paraquat-inducible membrane protein A [Gammaproteobacteria bacterium]
MTAARAGLVACHICDALSRKPAHQQEPITCPRCGATIHSRLPNSIARTWSLLIAAMILYIPANIYPIMSVVWLGQGEPSTIVEGVLQLVDEGMWPLAMIVFTASIFIPLLKMIVLALLLLSVQKKSVWRMRDRTRLYRITEFVGRWSMVDVFVIGILAALVQFGSLATIEPGIGSLSFAAVVVLTMVAAHSFDPRLIWDALYD